VPDLPAGDWLLRTIVPEGIFTLAVEADDATAATEHAAFADRCQPLLRRSVGGDADEAAWLREELIGQLAELRAAVASSGLGYLGALAGERDGRPVLILLALAAVTAAFPDGIDPASLLAATLRYQHPGAAVEEFPTANGTGVGIRRAAETAFTVPGATDAPLVAVTGTSQALVPFPKAGLLGTVTGFCYSPADIDTATVFTATIAHHMTALPQRLSDRHGHSDQRPVAAVQQGAAGAGRLSDDVTGQPYPDQVTFRQGDRGGQATSSGPLGLDLPAGEADADALGVAAEDQSPAAVAAVSDQAAQLTGRAAVAQQLRVVDQQDAGAVEGAERFRELGRA
jgi:hypothetical protein